MNALHCLPRPPYFACTLLLASLAAAPLARADEPPNKGFWAVDEIKEGMKGYGKTVMRGTGIERFEGEVLGVQRNVSPGRDMVLMRLKGCQLEHTGIIAGMSGSPVYVENKLLGAVAFAWAFGKDPIAGVTPFAQMCSFAGNLYADYAGDSNRPRPSAAAPGVKLWEQPFQSSFLSPAPAADAAQGFGMVRIKTPVMASGFSTRALLRLGDALEPMGMVPMAGGTVGADVAKLAANAPFEPGSPLTIGLVTGDFDLSAIGTVTHIEGDRVFGFGHPMMSLGRCEFPLMSGYIHTVYPRQSVSFKMGSPLQTLGTIDADVSTCVAGKLGNRPSLIPVQLVVRRQGMAREHRYNCQVIRQPELMPAMVMQVLTAAIDTEGNLPEELTLKFDAVIQPKGRRPIRLSDVFSGELVAGQMAPVAVYGVVPQILNILVRNQYAPVEIESIQCTTEIIEGRQSARIAKVRLDAEQYEPGERLKATVELEPHRGAPQNVDVSLELPANMPPGIYPLIVCDSMTSVRADLRNQPHLLMPENIDQLERMIAVQVAERRSRLYLRVLTRDVGIAVEGMALPELPGSVAQILTSRRATPAIQIRNELVSKVETPWVVQGGQILSFQVVQDKKLVK